MKAMKKVVSVVLALMMVMGMSATVFAAEVQVITYPITAPNDGHTYEVYQIFKGDFSDGVLSNVKWGANGTGTENDKVSDEILTKLEELSSTPSYTAELAVITKYANLNNPILTLNKDNLKASVVGGYYLIKDKDGSVTGHDAYTTYLVKVAGDVTISPKKGVPTVEKTVKDINDTTGATSWGETADYDIGDDVDFELKATLAANVESYDKYRIVFEDTLSEGLTFNDDVTVKFGEKDVTNFFDVAVNGQNITISCNDVTVKEFGATNNSVIIVKYSAELNDNAVVGSTGNTNIVKLKYSNDPNRSNSGENDPFGTTPEDKVVVFTYKLVANKIDQDKEPLKGAGFTLYKYDASVEGEDKYVAVDEEITGTDITTFEWNGLDDGNYKLVETTTPAGYNTIAPIEFTISADHSVDGIISLTAAGFTSDLEGGSLTTDVVNKPGSTLPETGGMGTTILYIAGAMLILGAGAALVMRRRRAEEN